MASKQNSFSDIIAIKRLAKMTDISYDRIIRNLSEKTFTFNSEEMHKIEHAIGEAKSEFLSRLNNKR